MAGSSEVTKQELEDVKKEIEGMKDNLSKVNKDMDEVKVMMTQMSEKLNMLEQLYKQPSPAEGMVNTPKQDILVASGNEGRNSNRSTEIYSWKKNYWFRVPAMNEEHVRASSFIHQDRLFVVAESGDTIETLDLNKLPPLEWEIFPIELPFTRDAHQTVVCQQSVIHIGGVDCDNYNQSNLISELQLTSPGAAKELCQMPEPRAYHGAEVIEDKVLILGGLNSGDETMDGVLEFDPTTKKCKEMPKLPFASRRMATVRWGDEVVVLGGIDKDNQSRSDVFMYNSKTGKITALPSMFEKRCACCAVITGDTIVVMGGVDDEHEILSSVECFTMGSSSWEYLPAMNDARAQAVAEVLPSSRKYV